MRRSEGVLPENLILVDLKDGYFSDPERVRVLRILAPPNDLAPVDCVGLLLTPVGEFLHLVVRDTAEDKEEASEDAISDGYVDVDRVGNLGWREETVGNVWVVGEGGDIVAV